MENLTHWQLHKRSRESVTLLVNERHLFTIYLLEQTMMRILIQKEGRLALNRSWSIAPLGEAPLEGRDRLKVDDFPGAPYTLKEEEGVLEIATDSLKVRISTPLALTWYYKEQAENRWIEIAQDRATSAYWLGRRNYTEIAHYRKAYHEERIYGLGEKAGTLERTGKKYEMRNLDAMGYDAESTDPLYKHIPFLLTRHQGVSYGLFYDNLSSSTFDLGNEIDNYHPRYRAYRAESGDIDYYFFVGPSIRDVTKKIVQLTGKTAFFPKWSLGYSGSTMSYTDAPNAQERLQSFLDLCKAHDIPCDSFQLSSGYTSIADKRYVFHWNKEKFPNLPALVDAYNRQGMKFIANIKPCLLVDHPQYEALAKEGLFIKNSDTGAPEISNFWDADGSHIDFTHPKAIAWWKESVTEALLKQGITATWNDNNEYEVWDRDAKCAGFGEEISIKEMRPVMPLLMMRTSKEAQAEFAPDERPFLISRSGCLGMQRYAQTWSGDNRTSWKSLKYNIKMGLGMSLSGLYNIGHDVGGFSGPKPEPELFLRWVQNGVMHPRFTIHSWNDDHTANEPWMYPEILPYIQDALRLRSQLMPYLYTLLWQAHSEDEPILKPLFLNYEEDPNTFAENDDFLLGDYLLVASVVEEGARTRSIYLPKEAAGWYDFHHHQWFSGGESIELDAPLSTLPLLVRGGSILPMTDYVGSYSLPFHESREFKIFPHPEEGSSQGVVFDDDGITHLWEQEEQYLRLNWELKSTPEALYLEITTSGQYRPQYREITCTLPRDEKRPLYINGVLQSSFTLI